MTKDKESTGREKRFVRGLLCGGGAAVQSYGQRVFTTTGNRRVFQSRFVQGMWMPRKTKILSKNTTWRHCRPWYSSAAKGKKCAAAGGSADALIKEAKIAAGDELSFEQLYDKYKKKKRFRHTAAHCYYAPMLPLKWVRPVKWGACIESLFPNICGYKKIENMANGADFLILTLYHRGTSKEDPIFDCIANNFKSLLEGCKRRTGRRERNPDGKRPWLTT
ncbi:MAG: hypothetical protein ACLU4N_08330 [Butyricimonas faecihominis]